MEYSNVLRALDCQGDDDRPRLHSALLEPLVILLAPFAPHIAEECWERLGNTNKSVFDAAWPQYDESLAVLDEIELVVQVNGKVRGRLKAHPGISEAEAVALALADAGVRRHTGDKEIRKAIYVQDRLLSLVV
jgi:leucyl-tRNA synthetase